MSHAPSSPLRRANGRPQACDPCRARKVACDHRQPVCNRCRKRGQDSACVYSASAPRLKTTKQSSIRNLSEPRISAEPAPPAESIGTTLPSPPSGPGYLGFTSHSTIFEETRYSLSLLRVPDTDQDCDQGSTGKSRQNIHFRDLSSPIREACLYVLQHLPGQSNELMVFHNDPYELEGWSHIAVSRIVHSLEETFNGQHALGEAELELVAERLCNNSTRPLRDIHTSPDEWMDQFCGSNLRWESIGLLWPYLERISDCLDALRSRHLDWIPGKRSADKALACLGYCIEISRSFNEGNDLLLDLCRRKATLESILIGDASLQCWNSHGMTASMMTFLGAHAQQAVKPYKPSLCSENKRRIFAEIFNSDKFTVSFTGRPPLVTRRYCSTPLPLDLRDEDLTADEATLMAAVNALDERGWNTKGELHPATLVRGRYMIATVMDELVDAALDTTTTVTIDQLQSLKARQLKTVSEFPASLAFDPENMFDSTLDTRAIYTRVLIHLAHLQNLFFVERLLLRHGAADEGNLLLTSFELVMITLVFWTHKDQFATMRRNFEWLVMAYAAPAGGILCLELLRPSFHGTHPKDSRVSRSAIIQHLSLLVGFLDWVRPPAPNADLCADCKTIIQRVLDHHLNSDTDTGGALQSLNWDFASAPDFNFELLDTFDWIRADWQ
ncbi:hypothetical protein B0J13DRAFT_475194 [Dactylonectria estremocensis]|uniref:Zn(2)-C6 fungal-type domain-containing protein n=1 Tax=Dactylonectria estremocensis TaxID=1079267 RepID=A0A9P9J6B3_9HYPO|nr:hypothetical protein B0J13DRAFT_475194 [Dactylonectria estremocensis]